MCGLPDILHVDHGSAKTAVRTVLWRILVFYIGAIFVISAVVPVGSAGLKSPFAAVLEAAGMPCAATAITLVPVAALLSALNANLYGASRMAYSLAERGEALRLLASVSKARVPVVAVLASVAFGVVTFVLELAFPDKVLPIMLNIVGSTCLLVWTSVLLAQLALRLRTDREGTELPLRMPGFPWLTCSGLFILAAIFTVGFIGEDSRPQLLSTFALVALPAVANWLHHRNGKVQPAVESSEGAKEPVLIDRSRCFRGRPDGTDIDRLGLGGPSCLLAAAAAAMTESRPGQYLGVRMRNRVLPNPLPSGHGNGSAIRLGVVRALPGPKVSRLL